MRRSLASALVLFSLCGAGAAAAAGPRPMTPATFLAVQAWVTRVTQHTPGRDDEAVAAIQAMSFDARVELNAGMALFFAALKGQKGINSKSLPEKQIVELGRAMSERPGMASFLKRAAVLHGDAALYGLSLQLNPDGPMDTESSGTPTTPLLSRHRLTLDSDGEILGGTWANWNWPFARSLLDLLGPRPADDPFVGTWYHATLAFMLGNGLNGETAPHLERAAAVLPDDARILFDRASYAEIMGMPRTQVLLSDEDVLLLEARRTGRRLPGGRGAQLGIPLVQVTNEEAERLFRRALQVDPSFVEARVRLGRLLGVRGRYEEAASELATALSSKPSGIVAFYARLFAGRAARALGKLDEAAEQVAQAVALFPHAQSALLAQSQLALLSADVPSALAPIERLDRSSSARDPWWVYYLAAGRDGDAILEDMWKAVEGF